MFELKKWHLLTDAKWGVRAYGYVFNNPRFSNGQDITTSHIEKIKVDEENGQIIIMTYSDSTYLLRFDEINVSAAEIEIIKKYFTFLDISSSVVDKCLKYREKSKEILRKEYAEILKQGDMYLIMAGKNVIDGYFKGKTGNVEEVGIRVHQGMNQDSVLIRGSAGIDFRYFPKGWKCDEIKPYQWSQGISRIIIKNIGERLKFINGDEIGEFLICEPGEELVVERSTD